MSIYKKPLLYSYIRFSTLEQSKGHSLSRQLSYAKKIAEEKGLDLDESLSMKDLGLSAFNKANISKGALGVFLNAVEQGRVPKGSILVIESLDRISRAAPLESQGIVAQIINADITVITAVDGKEYNKSTIKQNPMDLVYIVLVLIRANEESETKSKRVLAAITKQIEDWQSGKRGFRVKCGKPPKWVRWCEKSKQFVFVPREREIMLRKIELFRKGFGGLKIAEALNSEFGANTVHHTGANVYKEVCRRSLIGELVVSVDDNEFVLKGYYPKILTVAEFELLVADSSNRGAIKHTQKFVGILSGINVFKCGHCGKSVGSHVIYRNMSIDDVKSSHKRYGCVEARRNNNCSMKATVQIDVVEKAVVRFCRDKINLQRILLNGSALDDISNEESKLEARLEHIQRDISKLMDALLSLSEEPPQIVLHKMKALEADANEVKELIRKGRQKVNKINSSFRDEVTERWLQITENLKSLNGEQRLEIRQLVKDTFKSITLHVQNKHSVAPVGLESMLAAEMLGTHEENCFELTMEFHNSNKRLIKIDKYTGKLVAGFDVI